ncbi:MAG: tRNA (guanosine(46)-N7)-methyltransferase TrmB [Candidatus Coproplasma sp.]
MRMHKKGHLEERLAACSHILTVADLSDKNMKTAAEVKDELALDKIFGNDNPVHLEIGCGKGRFVTEMAKLYPCVNFVAVEKISNVLIEACESAVEQNLNNVYFLNCAAEVLAKYFAAGRIERIYLNFSNPLPKLGYAKQRLNHPRFLRIYRELLKSDGEIWQKTDDEEFYRFSLESYKSEGFEIVEKCEDLAANPFEGNVITEHERRFMNDGKKIFRVVARV